MTNRLSSKKTATKTMTTFALALMFSHTAYAETEGSIDNTHPEQMTSEMQSEAGQVADDVQKDSHEMSAAETSIDTVAEAKAPQDNQAQNEADTKNNVANDSSEKKSESATVASSESKNTLPKSTIKVASKVSSGYSADNLSATAQKVNSSQWQSGVKINQTVGTKVQALLNWHNHGVGAVDGWWGRNTQKAMQAFQKAQGLTETSDMNQETWDALLKGTPKKKDLSEQPVLVNYTLSDADINIKTTAIPTAVEEKSKLEGMYYESVLEALGEKFHMHTNYLKQLNPKASFAAGETITVYNVGKSKIDTVHRVVADKETQTLFAYDRNDHLVASYPSTVGSTATPSPTGTHQVKVKVSNPNYTYTSKEGKQTILPPGPNNPVGKVWIGLTKPSYGIHGSPDPERISRQASAGCVRLTNWDALALLDAIDGEATVEFK